MQDYQVISFDDHLTIGRDKKNDIVLNSRGVSRKHAIITKKEDTFQIIDQGSKNAIWFGTEIIRERILFHGLTFRIADYLLTFVDTPSENSQEKICYSNETEVKTSPDSSNETMLMVDFKMPRDNSASESCISEIQARIDTITSCTRELIDCPDDDQLMVAIINMAITATEAQGGFIATRDHQGDLVYRATQNFSPDCDNKKVNHQGINQVIETGKAIFCKTETNETKHTSYLCAPFTGNDRTIGCCYINSEEKTGFCEVDKSLLELIMAMSSVCYNNYSNSGSGHTPEEKTASGAFDKTNNKDVIVKSPNMERLYKDIHTISPINVPVLVLGEPGTGKELVALALHQFSKRKGKFVTLNCSAIPEGIFESELFGAVKGAFHNAQDRAGKLELAHQGTLFLDEIGDMGIALQPKLLRFLENQELTRLGDNSVKKLDVRIIAATNQDLQAMIGEKTFRPDLFQRLSCFSLKIPPLRDRRDDVEPLVNHFLSKFSHEYGWSTSTVSSKALDLLKHFHWPGNVRELRNTILRLAVHSQGSLIRPDDLTHHIEGIGEIKKHKVESFPSLEEREKEHIHEALKHSNWNISDASKMLGIARSTFYKKLKKYNINVD